MEKKKYLQLKKNVNEKKMFKKRVNKKNDINTKKRHDIKSKRKNVLKKTNEIKHFDLTLNTQNFKRFVVTNRNPIGLCGTPLNLVDLPLRCCVCKDWIFNGPWHLLNVPYESLVVVTGSAYMATRVWCPCNTVDTSSMVVQPCYRRAWYPKINLSFTTET